MVIQGQFAFYVPITVKASHSPFRLQIVRMCVYWARSSCRTRLKKTIITYRLIVVELMKLQRNLGLLC